ncbi:MAG: hypothetical protein QOJ96_652, partial [Alphaproteobacteria bacterium]|nr:hypothetical protein [Alphaproteobacteria bacterium]
MPSEILPSDTTEPIAAKPHVPLLELLGIFLRLGILAIGGGVQAFMYRDLVEIKKWISEKEYL